METALSKVITVTTDQLTAAYKSNSKYMPIWAEVKKSGIAKVSISELKLETVENAVGKLKKQDFHFRSACDLLFGYQLKLVFEGSEDGQHITVKLKDINDALNPINFI